MTKEISNLICYLFSMKSDRVFKLQKYGGMQHLQKKLRVKKYLHFIQCVRVLCKFYSTFFILGEGGGEVGDFYFAICVLRYMC